MMYHIFIIFCHAMQTNFKKFAISTKDNYFNWLTNSQYFHHKVYTQFTKQRSAKLHTQFKSFNILAVLRRSAKRVCGTHVRVIRPRKHGSHLSKKCRRSGKPLATLSNLTSPKFEPQTTRSRKERVTARQTERFNQT